MFRHQGGTLRADSGLFSKPRNKNIAEAFYRMGAIESWGRGYRKISNEFAAAGMPLPITESKFGGVLVTIPRGQVTEQVAATTEQVTEQVSAVLNLLVQEEMSIKRMMMELSLTHRPNFIENYLNPCTIAGYVTMTQPDSPKSPTQKYRLTEKGLKMLETI